MKRRFWSKGAAAQAAMKHLGLYAGNAQQPPMGPLYIQVVVVPSPKQSRDMEPTK